MSSKKLYALTDQQAEEARNLITKAINEHQAADDIYTSIMVSRLTELRTALSWSVTKIEQKDRKATMSPVLGMKYGTDTQESLDEEFSKMPYGFKADPEDSRS